MGGDSLAALLGGLFGLGVFGLAMVFLRATRRALAVVVVATCVLALPAAKLMQFEGWDAVAWLPPSAEHRVEIWDLTADRILERPLLGWGLENSRALPGSTEASKVVSGTRQIPLHRSEE